MNFKILITASLLLTMSHMAYGAGKGGGSKKPSGEASSSSCKGSIDRPAKINEITPLGPNKYRFSITPGSESGYVTSELYLLEGGLISGGRKGSGFESAIRTYRLMDSLHRSLDLSRQLELFDPEKGNTSAEYIIPFSDLSLVISGGFLPETAYSAVISNYNGCTSQASPAVHFKSLPAGIDNEPPHIEKIVSFGTVGGVWKRADGSLSYDLDIGTRLYASDNNAVKSLRISVDGKKVCEKKTGLYYNQEILPFKSHFEEIHSAPLARAHCEHIAYIPEGIHPVKIEAIDFNGNVDSIEIQHNFTYAPMN